VAQHTVLLLNTGDLAQHLETRAEILLSHIQQGCSAGIRNRPHPPPPGDLIGRIIIKKKIIKRGKKTKPACILKENKKD
jgi:hypothetical protein